MERINSNYRFIESFNTMLIILGVSGIIQPTTSALLHNMSTLGISLKSMTNLLDAEPGETAPREISRRSPTKTSI